MSLRSGCLILFFLRRTGSYIGRRLCSFLLGFTNNRLIFGACLGSCVVVIVGLIALLIRGSPRSIF